MGRGIIWCITVLWGAAAASLAWADSHREKAGDTSLSREMIVTAKRREAPMSRVPASIASLSREELCFVGADHISEALNQAAGVELHRGNGQEHLTAIRSPVLTGGAGAGSFLFLEDGVPLRAAGFANINGLFEAHSEMARGVEVVRGPGSVLYGSNAVHGLVNVLSPTPTGKGGLDVTWGRYGRGQVNAWQSSAHLLAALTLTHEGGYRQDAGLDQQKATVRYDWQKGAQRLQFTLSGHNLEQETAGFIKGERAYKDSHLARTNPNPNAYRNAKALRATLRYERDINQSLTLSLTPYARWNDMEFLMHFLPSQAREENSHKSLGLLSTLYWEKEKANFIFGADLEWTKGALKEEQSLPTVFSYTQGTHYDYEVSAHVAALYGQAEFALSESLSLIAGLRGDYTAYDYDNKTATGVVGRFQRVADRSDDFFTLTPKLGLVYAPSTKANLFLNYARGARAPQTTDLYRLQAKQTVGEIKEEELDSLELGVRGTKENLRYQVSLYAMKKRNFFFRDADGFNVTNGKTKHWGIEAEGELALSKEFTLSASAAYARHTYDFDNSVSANSTETITHGNDIDTAPRLTSNVRLQWFPTLDTKLEVEWVHMGRYYTDASNAHHYPGHDIINLRAAWEVTNRLELFGALRNVTNTDYAERADFSFGSERYFPGEERAAEIGVRLSF